MTTPARNYRELVVWQKGMDWVEHVYLASRLWPKEEIYGLTSQIRRAAVSVPSNIAEGQGRSSAKEFLHHLSIACGSLRELETQTILAQRLGYLSGDVSDHIFDYSAEVGRLLNGLMNSLNRRQQ